jgi:hypothetical protein
MVDRVQFRHRAVIADHRAIETPFAAQTCVSSQWF